MALDGFDSLFLEVHLLLKVWTDSFFYLQEGMLWFFVLCEIQTGWFWCFEDHLFDFWNFSRVIQVLKLWSHWFSRFKLILFLQMQFPDFSRCMINYKPQGQWDTDCQKTVSKIFKWVNYLAYGHASRTFYIGTRTWNT